MRDIFDVGLIDRRLIEKLQLIPELSLSKALEIARQHEQIKIQMKQQRENISSDEIKGRSRGRTPFRFEMFYLTTHSKHFI